MGSLNISEGMRVYIHSKNTRPKQDDEETKKSAVSKLLKDSLTNRGNTPQPNKCRAKKWKKTPQSKKSGEEKVGEDSTQQTRF
jgi:hypothetical protein